MSAPDSEIDFREIPVFWIGVTGFSPEQRAVIDASLHRRAPAHADWRQSYFGEADAWLVNGARSRLLPNGNVRVSPGLPTEVALNLDVGAADRPVAFATPVSDTNLEPHYTFDATSSASVQRMLTEFDACLLFARAQFVLGAAIVERGPLLRHGVFRVSYRNKLLAVLDFRRGEAALFPQMEAQEVALATWVKWPQDAEGGVPAGFIRSSPARLAWNYARRSERNLLPLRYRNRSIHYRNSPRVPLSWLRDSHLWILRELARNSATLSELSERGLDVSPHLERDLACLFYARAITTTKSKAAPLAVAQAYAKGTLLDESTAHAPGVSDSTVPGRVDQLGE